MRNGDWICLKRHEFLEGTQELYIPLGRVGPLFVLWGASEEYLLNAASSIHQIQIDRAYIPSWIAYVHYSMGHIETLNTFIK